MMDAAHLVRNPHEADLLQERSDPGAGVRIAEPIEVGHEGVEKFPHDQVGRGGPQGRIVGLGQMDGSSWSQHPEGLTQHGSGILQMLHHPHQDDPIERILRPGKARGVGHSKVGLQLEGLQMALCRPDLCLGDVHPGQS